MRRLIYFLMLTVTRADNSCPDKDSQLVQWRPGDSPNTDVTIANDNLYLLDQSTTVKSITVQDGGKLVFKDGVAPIVVKTKHILIEDGGEMHIGSPDCRYKGKVTIILQGKSTDFGEVPEFGRKFIGVSKGGTLEIHGKTKTAWTFLEGHLTGSLAEGEDKDSDMSRGLNVRVIDQETGTITAREAFDTRFDTTASDRFTEFITEQKDGAIIAISANDKAFVKLYSAGKTLLANMGSTDINSVGSWDPWAFITVKGSPSETVEETVEYITKKTTHYATTEKMFTNSMGRFRVYVKSGYDGTEGKASGAIELTDETDGRVITLADDVSSWEEGDRIVISSTDYSMYQAEEFLIGNCEVCNSNQVNIMGPVKYLHFGGSSYGVDMRAEVGLLSRNILIKGEMEASCYGDNFCQFFDFDTFGGHLKVVKGFKSVHLSGIEVFNMGQQILGSYPIHFHICGDVDELGGYTNPTWVKDLSIHHCFSRCVTIHATNGLLVQNVVGYDTLGHCFFLEDGNEQRNTLDHNLGLLTKPGTLLPSDRDSDMCKAIVDRVIPGYTPSVDACNGVSTFWLTHPNNTLTNNAAGGSEGVCYWFIFPEEPTGPSVGTLPPGHSPHSPVKKFYNNRAHSSVKRYSLLLSKGLKLTPSTEDDPAEYLSLTGNRHAPHVDADLEKPRSPSVIERYTVFKTKSRGIWGRGGDIYVKNSRFADLLNAITFASSGRTPYDPGSHQEVTDSIFVGESENRGTQMQNDNTQNWAAGFDGKMRSFPNDPFADLLNAITFASSGRTPYDPGSHQEVTDSIFVGESENRGTQMQNDNTQNWAAGFDGKMRSFPNDPIEPMRAIVLYDGPVSVERCQFKRCVSQHNDATVAIGFLHENKWQFSTTTRVKEASFDDVVRTDSLIEPMRAIVLYDGPVSVERCQFKRCVSQHNDATVAIGFLHENKWQFSTTTRVKEASFDDVTRRVWFGKIPVGNHADDPVKDGDKTQIFHDEDGSVSGYAGAYVVRADNYLLRHDGCVEKPEWNNAAICKGTYAQLYVITEKGDLVMSITRTDHPDKPLELESPTGDQYQPSMLLGRSYIIHWDNTTPDDIELHPINFNRYDYIMVGLCYPIGTTFNIQYEIEDTNQGKRTLTEVNSLAEVQNGDGGQYFIDKEVGLLFLKIITAYDREGWNYCSTQGCEYISILATMPSGATSVCPGQAYPKYQEEVINVPIG
ncbi:cell surface hyaluronidase [Lingula anatina]|uniref:Cell surface hyaluronidase n=1 Tax=Lingula anatina TaxID=7574 RepID=A0A2R2MS86_LINAN|nr:cell surface hyaluronidase [Lingula anatina]|eukprot:XP_023932993.1 cell surface hyaluronidase [Lingula anatina]